MTTTDTLALTAFVAFIAALFVPSILQRRRARRRAAVLARAERRLADLRLRAENKSLQADLDSADSLLNAYRTANGVLVTFITERHGAEVAASLPNPDAEPLWFAVEPELAWLDRETWGQR